MKKLTFITLAILFFAACNFNQPVRYASSSPEIDIFNSLLQDYVDGNWDSYKSYYADTARIRENVPDNQGVLVGEVVERYKETHQMFSNIGFVTDDAFVEMVVTDDGETWVNYWGTWEGTLNANGQRFATPLHITMQFKDGKVVAEHGYWDNAPVALALYKLSLMQE
jgi:uncharacterized protein